MKLKSLAVIATTQAGTTHQVALTDEMIESLISDLRNLYFGGNPIKVLDNNLEGLDIVARENLKKEAEQKLDGMMSDIIHRRELLESFCHFLDSKGMDAIYTENDNLINEYLDSNSG